MAKGIYITVSQLPPVTLSGAAEGRITGQRRPLTNTMQRRTAMKELIYTRCGDYYIPDLKLSEQPEPPHWQIWPYASEIPQGTPARPLQQPDIE